jgi:hypothetical protein
VPELQGCGGVVTDLPFTLPDPDPTRPERKPAKCRRHQWCAYLGNDLEAHEVCYRCNTRRDLVLSKRGRNNRKRGTSDELAVARILGGSKVGPLGLPWDVVMDGYLRVQCKRLDKWPSLNAVVAWLDAIPAGPELRAVTLADTPGPGGRTRRLIVLDLEEYARWHGRKSE